MSHDVRASAPRPVKVEVDEGVEVRSGSSAAQRSARETMDESLAAPFVEGARPASLKPPRTYGLPLFYVLDDEELAAKLPGMTVQDIQALREIFEVEAGFDPLKPDEPIQPENWKRAELGLQQKMRLWYGWSAWAAYEHQLAVQAEAERFQAMSK